MELLKKLGGGLLDLFDLVMDITDIFSDAKEENKRTRTKKRRRK